MNELINIQPLHILLLFLFFTQFPVSRACHEDEIAALLSFKSFLTDQSNRLSSWKIGQNCCDWYGIQCSRDSLHIISLDLRNTNFENKLRNTSRLYGSSFSEYGGGNIYYDDPYNPPTELNGTISPSLFNLTHLKYLDLSFNDFQFSQFPLQFANLKKLTHLDLSYSWFSGSITTQFANLSSLRYLDISSILHLTTSSTKYFSTNLETSTEWVRGLVNLQILRMDGVDLSLTRNWAEPISFLPDLKELHISDCNISTPVPISEFLNLSHLSSLRMGYNHLFKYPIPIQLANLTSLSVLDLSYCELQGSLPYLPQLRELLVIANFDLVVNLTWMFEYQWPKLQALSITLTNSVGSIPSSILNSLLVHIFASSCSIKGSFPTSILNLPRLQTLDLSGNDITGYLPSPFSNLSRLQYLDLSYNHIIGSIPVSICEIPSLRLLDLGGNNLTGTIPSCITKLRNLQTFEIDRNSIEGIVSLISLLNELNLFRLILNSNRITVEIDQNLSPTKFQLMRTLGLQSCNLKGYIPTFLCNFTHIYRLDLSHNNLTGVIPTCLFELQTLVDLDLSQNNLEGTIPLPPPNLSLLDLSQNKFNGAISIEVGERLSSYEAVSLSGNKLSGSIPFSMCSSNEFSDLSSLDLSNNQLSGTIPSSLGYCTMLYSLHLGMNNLTGNVPNELKQAAYLQFLQLNDNALNGSFPNFIQQLQNLEVLNLGNNNFRGSIPTFIGSLRNLKILSLRSNKFDGFIPNGIGNLHILQILDVSLNSLSGRIPRKIGNLKMLTSRTNETLLVGGLFSFPDPQLKMVINGILTQLEHVYSYSLGIDLSCNILEGNIPKEMGQLKGLAMLNLSHNRFSGKIPTSVGNMTGLGSLDLSFNKLSGHIPQSLTGIDSLGYLNLSYNNLSGRIPSGPHFDSLSWDGSAYIGNSLLCGTPANLFCEGDVKSPTDGNMEKDEDDGEDTREKLLFYGVVFLGFGVGFWGLFLVLPLRKKKWWFGYWRLVDKIVSRITGGMKKK